MIRVEIESVRMSLMVQARLVVLKDTERERFLPIWIGPFEADAITLELQGVQVSRPLTHDLLRSVIETAGLTVQHIVVNDLRNETFYATIVVTRDGETLEIDSRPSDAIALAVRVEAPIFVAEEVMDDASVAPVEGLDLTDLSEEDQGRLSIFSDFLNTLDVDDMDDDGGTDS
jgi:bifunctional DNase/RNase